MTKLSKNQIFIIIILLLGTFLFYTWKASLSSPLFSPGNVYTSYYDLLTDAFLKGQFNLPINVPQELLDLENPYDPVANKKYREMGLADISLYKGKLYLYFGTIPVIVLYLPVYLITKLRVSDSFVIAVFMFGNLILGTLLLLYLRSKYFQTIPMWMFYISILVLGFANMAPYLISESTLWSIPISCGVFFLVGAVYFLCTAIHSDGLHLKRLTLASFFLGLAVASRPNFFVASIILIIFVLVKLLYERYKTVSKTLFLSLVLPFAICIVCMGFYNYARFEDITEFGIRYQLTLHDNSKKESTILVKPNAKRVGNFLNYYLLSPPLIDQTFPYIHKNVYLTAPYASLGWAPLKEDIVGLLPSCPFILMFFLAPLVYWIYSNKNKFKFDNISFFKVEIGILISIAVINFICLQVWSIEAVPYLLALNIYCLLFLFSPLLCWYRSNDSSFFKFEFWILFLIVFVNFLFLIFWNHVTYRYLADVNTRLILLCTSLWFYCDCNLPDKSIGKSFLRSFGVISAIVSIYAGFAFSL